MEKITLLTFSGIDYTYWAKRRPSGVCEVTADEAQAIVIEWMRAEKENFDNTYGDVVTTICSIITFGWEHCDGKIFKGVMFFPDEKSAEQIYNAACDVVYGDER